MLVHPQGCREATSIVEDLGVVVHETLKALDVTTFEQKLEICNILGESIGQHDAVSIESRITSVLDDWSTQKIFLNS